MLTCRSRVDLTAVTKTECPGSGLTDARSAAFDTGLGQPLPVSETSLFRKDRCSRMLIAQAQPGSSGAVLGGVWLGLCSFLHQKRKGARLRWLRQRLSGPKPGARRACHLPIAANAQSRLLSVLLQARTEPAWAWLMCRRGEGTEECSTCQDLPDVAC